MPVIELDPSKSAHELDVEFYRSLGSMLHFDNTPPESAHIVQVRAMEGLQQLAVRAATDETATLYLLAAQTYATPPAA